MDRRGRNVSFPRYPSYMWQCRAPWPRQVPSNGVISMQCKSDTGSTRHPTHFRAVAPLYASLTVLLQAMSAATTAPAGVVCETDGVPPCDAGSAAGPGAVACGAFNDSSSDWSVAF